MEGPRLSQKEYLRKYLSDGVDDGKKKKKKKLRVGPKTVKIIDDDVDLKSMRPIEDGEFEILMNSEDGPQIVGVIDERGPADFADKRRWKIIADDGEGNVSCKANETESRKTIKSADDSLDWEINRKNSNGRERNASDGDLSPPRSSKHKKVKKKKSSEKRSRESSSERSEQRERKKSSRNERRSTQNRSSDSDQSPPRKSGRNPSPDSDQSLPRRSKGKSKNRPKDPKNSDSDLSPPRVSKKSDVRSKRNRSSDSDQSLPRRSRRSPSPDSDQSLPRRSKGKSQNRARASKNSDSDLSPPRASRRNDTRSKQDSKYGESRQHGDRRSEKKRSSPRRSRWSDDRPRRSRSPKDTRPAKTLDGIKAGLQDAHSLKSQTEEHRKREANMYKKMSVETSGFGQSTVFRDRKTGRRRDFAAEETERREKDKRQNEIDEKYAKWGRGLKQMEEMEQKRARDLYEMSKPLARYATDADLDKALREVEREGDTMLEEIKKRQIKEGKRKPEAPSYQGSYAPNRFGIKPGHRWDGVDRSNGYEKKWFDARNARTAIQEEAYKWSTADM